MTKLFEVQEAIFQQLNNAPTLISSTNGIYDSVPDKKSFPYVVLGRVHTSPLDTKTTEGEKIEVTIDIWSGSKGKKETISIASAIMTALENDISITGLLSQNLTSLEVLEEVNDLYHGTLTYEIILDY